jgi:hypothetical protein
VSCNRTNQKWPCTCMRCHVHRQRCEEKMEEREKQAPDTFWNHFWNHFWARREFVFLFLNYAYMLCIIYNIIYMHTCT